MRRRGRGSTALWSCEEQCHPGPRPWVRHPWARFCRGRSEPSPVRSCPAQGRVGFFQDLEARSCAAPSPRCSDGIQGWGSPGTGNSRSCFYLNLSLGPRHWQQCPKVSQCGHCSGPTLGHQSTHWDILAEPHGTRAGPRTSLMIRAQRWGGQESWKHLYCATKTHQQMPKVLSRTGGRKG